MTNRPPFDGDTGAGQAHLRLIATTDLHCHVFAYDYFTDRPSDAVGLARAATLIAEARAGAANTLVLDNGDFLQGNPLGDYMAYEHGLKPGRPHPILRAMAAAGIEASTLGNHEFNYGLDFLADALSEAPFPVVSANVATRLGATPAEDATLVPPHAILARQVTDGAGRSHSLRIGVIGFVPPQILQWDHHILNGRICTRDIVETARARVPELRAAGADIVVALAHSGIGAAEALPAMENAATALGAVPGIDAIICGHTHRLFPSAEFEGQPGCDTAAGTLNGTPAVMAGFWGSHIGTIDLLLERTSDGWRVAAAQSGLRAITRAGPDGMPLPTVASTPAVEAAGQPEHDGTLAYIRRPVGHLTAPLHSYFALVTDCPSVQIVAAAQTAYVTEMLEETEHAGLPVLSAAGPFKAGGRGGPAYYTDVPAGDIALKNVADLYLYPNTITALRITGGELAEWLERAAALYNLILPGVADQPLVDPAFPSYNFDVIEGVSYRIDLSRPARYDRDGRLVAPEARRVLDLAYDGRPVAPEAEFILATNNYRAGGGGDFPGARAEAIVLSGPDTNRDVLLRYIHARGTIDPTPIGNWGFAPMPGTSVTFDTGPGARRHAAEVATLALEEIGTAPGGLIRFRIRL